MNGIFRSDWLVLHLRDAIGDDLVGIHIRAGTGSGLVDVDYEVLIEIATSHLLSRLDDGRGEMVG